MKAKVLSVTPKPYGEGKTLYHVVCDDGKMYTCFSQRIKDMVGQTIEFDVVEKEYKGEKQYTLNLPKDPNAPQGFFGGAKRPFTPSFKDSREAVVLGGKTMVLSYVKDICNKNAEITGVATSWETVKTGFKELIPLLDLDSLPKVAEIKPEGANQAIPEAPKVALSQAKQAIITQKCKILNFRAKDLIDYAAVQGIELKYEPSTDTALISQLSEDQGAKLIEALQDAAR